MARPRHTAAAIGNAEPPARTTGMMLAALTGLGFSAASTWVHYRLLHDPTYSSFCDVNTTFSCTEAYTSRYGSVNGVPVALLGVLFFAFVIGLIALCRQSASARQNLPGYVFAASTIGLAAVLYFAYASFFILGAVCLLCVGTYAAVIALFLLSGAATRYPMSTLFTRAGRDFGTLLRTPAALTAAIAFVAGAAAAIAMFPGEPISASTAAPAAGAEQAQPAPAAAVPQPVPANIRQQIERMLEQAQRVPVLVPSSGADVVIVKFNDYQCPPCRQTYLDFKPVIAKLQQQNPGKVQFMTKDFPLDPECNSLGGGHMAACEAAVAVRLAREKGRAEALEDWLFQNQPSLTPDMVKAGARDVGNVADFEARYQATLGLVRGDISQGLQLGVNGTPTFFMNGIRLPNFNRGEYFEVAVDWELRRVAASRKQ